MKYIYIYIIYNESAVQGWENPRELAINPKTITPHTNPRKEEKEKIVGDKIKKQIRST